MTVHPNRATPAALVMTLDRPIRFPLSPGHSALAVTLLLAVVSCALWLHRFFVGHLPAAVSIPLALAKLLWLVAFIPFCVRLAWKRRASDVVITPHGVEVSGGPHHGRRWSVDELPAERVRVVENHDEGAWRLWFGETLVAESEDPDEAGSLSALAETIRAVRRPPARPGEGPLGPEVVRCENCGAPVVPGESATVPCAYCRASVALPEAVRAVASTQGSRERAARALAALLRWRPARSQNALLALSFVPAVIAWPAAAVFYALFMDRRGRFDALDEATLLAAASALTFTLAMFVRSRLARRRAVALFASRFRARAPEEPGRPYGCRTCGGPLPGTETVEPRLVVCAYCRADNVAGLALAHEALDERAESLALDAALTAREQEQRRLRWWTIVSASVLVSTPFALADLVLRARG